MNERIRARTVRVINDKGVQLGVMSSRDALKAAREAGLDLVEVAPDTNPPVCKFLDYGKYKYRQRKRNYSAKSHHRMHFKEVRMKAGIDEHDLLIKIKKMRELIEKGDKVLVTLRFIGRQMAHKEFGEERMNRILRELEDIIRVDRPPKFQGRRLTMTIVPK